MDSRHTITRAAELESLAELRAFIGEVCQQHSIDNDTAFSLQLAVDEAAANIITHGYAGMDPGSLMLQLEVYSDKVVVRLTDFGHPFEPSQAPQPDFDLPIEARDLGGFGLFFIYSVMDAVDYETGEAGNCLVLTKKLS